MSASIEDVVTVVQQLTESQQTPPVVIDIEEKLTEITTADNEAAYEAVSDALEAGVIEEDDARTGFSGIRLTEEADLSPSDETPDEDAGSPDSNPGENVAQSGEQTDADQEQERAKAGDGYIHDPNFSGDIDAVQEHYHDVRPVLEEMALLGDEYPTLGFGGNAGWYQKRDAFDVDRIEAGYSKRARCTLFSDDLDEIINSQVGADGREREIFNISSWKDPEDPKTWKHLRKDEDNNTQWHPEDGSHPPGYETLRGFGFWVDLDLEHKDGRESLTDAELATVERVQQRVIETVANAYGVPSSEIYALDSGGGCYIYGPPEAALQICAYLDDDEQARQWFFDALADRINDGPLSDAVDSILEEEDAGDLLDPDWIHNKNRQTKAPGSLHHSHDIVVTPLRDREPDGTLRDTDEVDYTPTRISKFSQADAQSLEGWASGLTAIEHAGATGAFLTSLYPERASDTDTDTDGWRNIVDSVVAEQRGIHERQQQRKEERLEKVNDWTEGTSGELDHQAIAADSDATLTAESGLYEGADIVTDPAEVDAAISTIDIHEVIQNHASITYDTSNRSHETTFKPSWRSSGSGKSCAIPNGENRFVDNGCNGGGGPIRAYALGEGILSTGSSDAKAAARSITGAQFSDTIRQMRADGYSIPVYVPEPTDENEYDQTPLWALRKAALALGVIESPDGFVEHETDEDADEDEAGTYLGFDAETYNAVLTALEEEGVTHGREPVTSSSSHVVGWDTYATPDVASYTSTVDMDEIREFYSGALGTFSSKTLAKDVHSEEIWQAMVNDDSDAPDRQDLREALTAVEDEDEDLFHCEIHDVSHGPHQLLAAMQHGCEEADADDLAEWQILHAAWKEAKGKTRTESSGFDDAPEQTYKFVAPWDPVPYQVLREIALTEDIVSADELAHCDADTGTVVDDQAAHAGETVLALPSAAYNQTLALMREDEEYQDPNREPVTGDSNPTPSMPTDVLARLDDDEQRRMAKKYGTDIPQTDSVRQDLRDSILREMRNGNFTVIDAPTGAGKSYTSRTEPWLRRSSVTGDSPVIMLHETKAVRDAAFAESEDAGLRCEKLRSREEASPVARGDHDPKREEWHDDPKDGIKVTINGEPASEWFNTMCDDRGVPFSTAYSLAVERQDQDREELPPFGSEDPALSQWENIPRDDDGAPVADIIHATHNFAFVPSIRAHTNLIIDEQPDYRKDEEDLSHDDVQRMVTAYLKEIEAPVQTWEAFVSLAKFDAQGESDASNERDALEDAIGEQPRREWYFDAPGAHALAPDMTKAIWNAFRWNELDANGRRSAKTLHEQPRYDTSSNGGDHYGGTWLSVVLDADNRVTRVRNTPDLSSARSVVGLDAHPCMPLWELNGPPGVTRDALLDPEQRSLWRRYERGLKTVQIGDATRPRSGGNATQWMSRLRVRAILKRLRAGYGEGFKTALTTAQVEDQLADIMRTIDIDDEEAWDLMHFGEEKSRNDFADEDVGYIYGCMDPGDSFIIDTLAELNLDATPSIATDEDGNEKTDDAGDPIREKGRTFEGDDAETANALLASVRENHVAQAAGRYARNADDPDDEAVVYIDTSATPVGFIDIEASGVEWLATDLQQTIIETLANTPDATTKAIAETCDCTREHVRTTLQDLQERGLVSREAGAGAYGADIYATDVDGAAVDLGGTTGLSLTEEASAEVSLNPSNYPLLDPNRWSLEIVDRTSVAKRGTQATGSSQPGGVAQSPGDEPVDATGPPG